MPSEAKQDELIRVEDLAQLVQLLDLTSVTFYEVSARLNEEQLEEKKNIPVEVAEVELNWEVRVRHDDNELGVRLRNETETPKGRIVVDVAAEYEASTALIAPAAEIVFDFVNEVAVMQLIPYVRETISSMTSRVFGESLLMPVMQRGDIHFEGMKVDDSE